MARRMWHLVSRFITLSTPVICLSAFACTLRCSHLRGIRRSACSAVACEFQTAAHMHLTYTKRMGCSVKMFQM